MKRSTLVGILLLLVVIAVVAIFVWPRPFDARQTAAPAQTTSPAAQPAPPAAEPAQPAVAARRPPEPSLPVAELPAVNPEVRRLVDLVKRRQTAAASRGSGALIVVCGASGARYELYYNGDARGRSQRGIMIRDIPSDAEAHEPASLVSLNSMTIWDMGLDGTVDQGTNGSPWAPTPFETRSRYQGDAVGEQFGSENRETFQRRYNDRRRDILSGPSCPR
ncbi:MAG TPA: hypothetical protein VF696_00490 [Candidatus Paceibacterota bacterium]